MREGEERVECDLKLANLGALELLKRTWENLLFKIGKLERGNGVFFCGGGHVMSSTLVTHVELEMHVQQPVGNKKRQLCLIKRSLVTLMSGYKIESVWLPKVRPLQGVEKGMAGEEVCEEGWEREEIDRGLKLERMVRSSEGALRVG